MHLQFTMLICLVVDLANEESIKLIWSWDSKKFVKPKLWEAKKQFNVMVSGIPGLPVESQHWLDEETCMHIMTTLPLLPLSTDGYYMMHL